MERNTVWKFEHPSDHFIHSRLHFDTININAGGIEDSPGKTQCFMWK